MCNKKTGKAEIYKFKKRNSQIDNREDVKYIVKKHKY